MIFRNILVVFNKSKTDQGFAIGVSIPAILYVVVWLQFLSTI